MIPLFCWFPDTPVIFGYYHNPRPPPLVFRSPIVPDSLLGARPLQAGKQVLCRVHLVPIRSGLLVLPRLDVTAEGGGASQGGVEVWVPDMRKVLVLPPGDAASVCQARAP